MVMDFFKLETGEASANLLIKAVYVPTLRAKEHVLLAHPYEILSALAGLSDLTSFSVTVEIYGQCTDEQLRDLEQIVRDQWESIYLTQDELLHSGRLSSVLGATWFTACALACVFYPIATPFLALYMAYNVISNVAYLKRLKVARKFRECAEEISNSLRIVSGTDKALAEKIERVQSRLDALDGNSQDIFLKLALECNDLELPALMDFYLSLFRENKPTRGYYSYLTGMAKMLLTDEEGSKIKVSDRKALKRPFMMLGRQSRQMNFYLLPVADHYEVYLSHSPDELRPWTYIFSEIPERLYPLAHIAGEKELDISTHIRVPRKMDVGVDGKLSQSLYITRYAESKMLAFRKGHILSFEGRQLPIALTVVGVLQMAVQAFKGALSLSPLLVLGVATYLMAWRLTNRLKKHYHQIAGGFDRLFENPGKVEVIEDNRLAELDELFRDSTAPVDAYTNAYHKALEFGWDDVAQLYQRKAIFHQREFKEPGNYIMRLKR